MNCLSDTTRQIIWNNEQLGIYKIRFFVVAKNRLYFYYVKKEKRSPKICIRLQAIKHRLCFQFIDPIRIFNMKIPCSVKSYHQFLCSMANSLILFFGMPGGQHTVTATLTILALLSVENTIAPQGQPSTVWNGTCLPPSSMWRLGQTQRQRTRINLLEIYCPLFFIYLSSPEILTLKNDRIV